MFLSAERMRGYLWKNLEEGFRHFSKPPARYKPNHWLSKRIPWSQSRLIGLRPAKSGSMYLTGRLAKYRNDVSELCEIVKMVEHCERTCLTSWGAYRSRECLAQCTKRPRIFGTTLRRTSPCRMQGSELSAIRRGCDRAAL